MPQKAVPKPLLVQPVSQSSIHFKPLLLQRARPKPASVQKRRLVFVPSNPGNSKGQADDEGNEEALFDSSQCDPIDVSNCLSVEISEVVSLADKEPSGHTESPTIKTIDLTEIAKETNPTGSNVDSNLSKLIRRHERELLQIAKIVDGETAQATQSDPNIEMTIVDIASSVTENADVQADSAVVQDQSQTELKDISDDIPKNQVSAIEVEKPKTQVSAVGIEKSKHSDQNIVIEIEKSKNSDQNPVIEVEKSKNIVSNIVIEVDISKNSDTNPVIEVEKSKNCDSNPVIANTSYDNIAEVEVDIDQQSSAQIQSENTVQVFTVKEEYPEIEVMENPSPNISKIKPIASTSSSIVRPLNKSRVLF